MENSVTHFKLFKLGHYFNFTCKIYSYSRPCGYLRILFNGAHINLLSFIERFIADFVYLYIHTCIHSWHEIKIVNND